MKRIAYILSFILITSCSTFAQDAPDGNIQTVREKMIEYIQDRLGLSKPEADRFGPVYIDYFRELRDIRKTYKGDPLVMQQKIVDLRLRYRDQFKPIIGEKRSNDVFVYERDFIQKARQLLNERKGGH